MAWSLRTTQLWLVVALYCAHGDSRVVAAPSPHTFEVDEVNIRYFVEGKGEPVVLIHGLHSSAQMNWMINGVFAGLAKDHQVIALGLPGHGQSDKPVDENAYGTQVVADVVALLDHLNIKRAHVVGYSLGGMVAVQLLVTYPERTLSGTLGGMGSPYARTSQYQ
jgi:pimeloyl-ACP methyl ester carboxylesterase